MNFKWKCCKHLVVSFVKVLLESFFLLKIPYYHPIFAVSLHIKLYLSKEVQCVLYDGQKFFLFDSHAKYENGRSCSDGTCILGTCSCLARLCSHLRNVVKSSVFLFCAIWGATVWFACFSTENFTFKKKDKKIFCSCQYRLCKDKAKENCKT